MPELSTSNLRMAVDIGGTFTDVVIEHDAKLTTTKVLTTPDAPEHGFLDGVRLALRRAGHTAGEISSVIHGTTLPTNALIERTGATTALITTEGFRDSLEIGYEARYDQYDITLEKTPPLVPRRLRFTVPERLTNRGEVLTPLDERAVHDVIPVLEREQVSSVTIGFLHSYANLAHEQRAAAIVQDSLPDVAVTLSGEVCPEMREYERLSTATANAYIQPLMSRYLTEVDAALRKGGFKCPLLLVTSAGSMTTLATALRFPIRLVESGPSGGAVLASTVARQCGEQTALSYDMGGTTAKICLIEDSTPRTARQFEVARAARFMKGSGIPVRVPVIDMIEIGAGGGSIARVDGLGRLQAGPQSAGAKPGPACYGQGGSRATVTDADLVLGNLNPSQFAEGRITLLPEKALAAIDIDVAQPLSMPIQDAARGISDIVEETMANAARVHAVERGTDLMACTLIAFGGSAPLHAVNLSRKLEIQRVIVPVNPSVGSAVGFLQAPLAYEVVQSRYTTASSFDADGVKHLFEELEQEARQVVDPDRTHESLSYRRLVLMRYVGQGHEIEIELPNHRIDAQLADVLRARYDRRYVELFGRALPDVEIEMLTWSLTVSTPEQKAQAAGVPPEAISALPSGSQPVWDLDTSTYIDAPSYWRPDLAAGAMLAGPSLVAEGQTTTWVPAGYTLRVDNIGNLIIEPVKGDSNHD